MDEREYSVYRDTMTGYYVFDPQLGFRIAEKKEEVTRFLWQHLGVEPGTDLAAPELIVYTVDETLEAGLQLRGSEVKALRDARVERLEVARPDVIDAHERRQRKRGKMVVNACWPGCRTGVNRLTAVGHGNQLQGVSQVGAPIR